MTKLRRSALLFFLSLIASVSYAGSFGGGFGGTTSGGGGGAATIAIGDTVTGGNTGSVLFIGAGPILEENNPNFFWDDGTSRLGIQNNAPAAALSIGAASDFRVNDLGNITRILNVPYSFPALQGAALTFLQNDGSGNLTWAAAGTGTVTGTGVANRVAFWSGTSAITSDADFTFNGTNVSVANPMFFSAGSAAAPSVTFTGDTDNGLYLDAANQPAVSGGGSRKMYFAATQNISDQQFGVVATSTTGAFAGAQSYAWNSSTTTESNATLAAYGNNGSVYGGVVADGLGTEYDTVPNIAFGSLTNHEVLFYANNATVGKVSTGGQWQFMDGTAALPSITNIGDANTGVLFPAADTVAFSTAGSERVRIDSSGRVGVGVSPAYAVDVTRNSNAPESIVVTNSNAGAAAQATFAALNNAGNYFQVGLQSSGTAEAGLVGANVGYFNSSGRMSIYTANANEIRFGTNSTERLRITSTGNLEMSTDADFIPATTGQGDIGTSTFQWNTANIQGIQMSQVTTGTPDTIRVPTDIVAGAVTHPTCSTSTNAGQITYFDDTTDALSAELCVCRADLTNTYSWVKVADNTTACI